jgi:hypothetical protein
MNYELIYEFNRLVLLPKYILQRIRETPDNNSGIQNIVRFFLKNQRS